MLILEIVSLSVNTLLFGLYHFILFWKIHKNPLSTAAGQNDIIRQQWIRLVHQHHKDILAVQQLRNNMMSSSLLATTALTLSSILAAFFIKGESGSKVEEINDSLSDLFSVEHKLFVMIILFMLSFFSFMQSVRLNSHAGFMMSVPPSDSLLAKDSFVSPDYVSRILFRTAIYHTIGTRLFYAAFLSILWIFGPIPSTVATVILMLCLYYGDYPSVARL